MRHTKRRSPCCHPFARLLCRGVKCNAHFGRVLRKPHQLISGDSCLTCRRSYFCQFLCCHRDLCRQVQERVTHIVIFLRKFSCSTVFQPVNNLCHVRHCGFKIHRRLNRPGVNRRAQRRRRPCNGRQLALCRGDRGGILFKRGIDPRQFLLTFPQSVIGSA